MSHSFPHRLGRFCWYWLPLILWMAIIFLISDQSRVPHPGHRVGMSDYTFEAIAHAGTFGLLTLLAWRVLDQRPAWLERRRIKERKLGRAILGAAVFAALYGLSDEIHQRFVPGRTSALIDWLADLGGVILAMGALWLWIRLRPHVPFLRNQPRSG